MDPKQSTRANDETEIIPTQIGRYRIEKQIGRGGFGAVYLGYDKDLDRNVAIKVPHRELVNGTNGANEYLREAQLVAKLDHPNIVPVYDVGSCDDFKCFVVSKLIPGQDLAKSIARNRRPSLWDSVDMIAAVADALQHAHKNGIVHRDVKPSNILIDLDGKPYLADFGLALPERMHGSGPRYAGTPAYMSPEQARGEGHRVDGRSDVFSLGAVLYELITGKRAFDSETEWGFKNLADSFEVKPLRQHNEGYPKELDRICQKALAKRSSERYSTAHDLAEELRTFARSHGLQDLAIGLTKKGSRSIDLTNPVEHLNPDATRHASSNPAHASTVRPADGVETKDPKSHATAIIPRGLRSFDAHDADFFIELLPGPRSRDGLPENLRFWKARIESMDADNSCSVGLIYGLSGCGKSSFVKAGLLPRLAKHVIPFFVECSADFTEKKLVQILRKAFPELSPEMTLSQMIAAIRRGAGTAPGKKVLFIFDQFEQWLHARADMQGNELFKSLRQCDGERVQAILLVRADFWMAVTWLLEELEIDLVQGTNFGAIDLFPQRHAEKVLVAYGRAYGALPAEGDLSTDQLKFITDSIEGLTQDGKVMCVRLAVYAEMMKSRPWGAESLRKYGGTEGVGVSFLEESFGELANPKIRAHQLGARLVLKALLPEGGTIINVQMKSYEQLYQASGYANRKQFDDLIRMLDGELRLISPTDPKGVTQEPRGEVPETVPSDPGQRYYRLSHDYLIPALRSWLNRKQRETWRGRAELLLAELAGFWRTKRTHRYLPSVLEHARIRLLTSPRNWDAVETEMMRATSRKHGVWLAVSIGAIALISTGVIGLRNSIDSENRRIAQQQLEERYDAEAARLVESLLTAETQRVSDISIELEKYRTWADNKLQKSFDEFEVGSVEKLHSAMALADVSQEGSEYLVAQLPLVGADQFIPVCNTLRRTVTKVPEIYEVTAIDAHRPLRERLQAACAIAQFGDSKVVWKNPDFCRFVADNLTRLYPSELAPLRQALRPVANAIVPPLHEIFMDHTRDKQQRLFATESLVEFQQDSPEKLFELLLDCDERQYPLVLRALRGNEDLLVTLASEVLKQSIAKDSPEPEKDSLAVHQANAAVALYQLNQFNQIWTAMSDIENPRLRSFIIHWLVDRGSSPIPLIERLTEETDPNRLQGIMLALGEFEYADFAQNVLEKLTSRLEEILRDASTSDLRASAICCLRAIGRHESAKSIVDQQKDSVGKRSKFWRERLATAKSELASLQATAAERQSRAQSEVILQIQNAEFELDGLATVSAKLNSLSEISRIQSENSIVEIDGLFDKALRFSGDTSAMLVAGRDDKLEGPFSYGCWFATNDDAQFSSLFSRMDADSLKGFDLWMEQGQLAAHVKNSYIRPDHPDNHYIKLVAQKQVADGHWHHVMVSYDGSKKADGVQITIDGQLCKTLVVSDTMSDELIVSAPLIIGGRPRGFEFTGALSNVTIINQSLNPTDVRALYYSSLRPLAQMTASDLNQNQADALERACFSQDLQILAAQEAWDKLEREQISELNTTESDWWYTSRDHWMIRIKAGKFRMGTLPTETYSSKDATQHTCTIDRTFALAAHEVTVRQWLDFQENAKPNFTNNYRFRDIADWTPDSPMVNITWCEAVQYCNWLSEQEGIPESQWCYVPDPVDGYAPGMLTKPEFWKLTGYRLPTGSEWEYACRAGSTASRSYGTSDALLEKYAWYQVNSKDKTNGVGLLKPNQYGFFDMNGNAAEWVFDVFNEYPYNADSAVDHPGRQSTLTTAHRTLRGGGYYDLPNYVSSGIRFSFDPTHSLAVTGLRIARTLEDASVK